MVQELLVDWRVLLRLTLANIRARLQLERPLAVIGLIQGRLLNITLALLNLVAELVFLSARQVVVLEVVEALEATLDDHLLAMIVVVILLRLVKLGNQDLAL